MLAHWFIARFITNFNSLLFYIESYPFHVGHTSNFILLLKPKSVFSSEEKEVLSIFFEVDRRLFFVLMIQSDFLFISDAILR